MENTNMRMIHLRHRSVTAMIAATTLLLAACGGAAAPAPAPTPSTAPTVAKATVAPATPATTPTTAAVVVNIEANEAADGHFVLTVDRLAVPAGKVTFKFANKGKMMHEVFVYPVQDITMLLGMHRKDKKVDEAAALKNMAGLAEDVDAGKTATFEGTLAPGFYELACHARSKDPSGKTFTHFDKGQFVTLAVTGPGGPSASVATAASAMNVQMKGEEKGPWLFVPDRLLVSAGVVTFKVTNGMKAEHDFVVSPVTDTTVLVTTKIDMGMAHGFDYGKIKGTELFEDLAAGTSGTKTLTLAPGTYVAACYMVSKASDGTPFLHRDMGQRFVFEVK